MIRAKDKTGENWEIKAELNQNGQDEIIATSKKEKLILAVQGITGWPYSGWHTDKKEFATMADVLDDFGFIY